ncbi:WD40 repeat domain-containing protein [Actinoplanes couchii]|uniref:WD-40 repeat protein n=1 Tax=Actinoplanes couchii TaxID=403638 RepID=A0ABQ3XK77_9ACTN|nr:WD40 repeat domain-containing protein [Actinoplanes couchii]MDR6320503.1 WD40 repeat protein [Actinoplanes couchii]GID58908.1 hypothetical protein Aco03nite_073120 [Actinoplanes couchii]
MSEQSGWDADLVMRESLGTLRPETITAGLVGDRTVLVFAGTDDEGLPVRFADLDTGALLPDRSLLHSAHLVTLGQGDGRVLLATVTARGTIAVRDASTGVPIGPAISGPASPVAVGVGLAGGREVVTVSDDDTVRGWDILAGTEIGTPAPIPSATTLGPLTVTAGRAGELSVSGVRSPYYGGAVRSFGGWAQRAGRILAVLNGDPAIFYDVEEGVPFTRVPLPELPEDHPVDVIIGDDGFHLWDDVRRTEIMRRPEVITAGRYRENDDHAHLVTGSADGSVRVWNVNPGQPLGNPGQLLGNPGQPLGNPGRLGNPGQLIGGPWTGHTAPVTAVTLAQWQGREVAVSADASGTVRMWPLDGPLRHPGHGERVSAITGGIVGGRPLFASGGDDGTIRRWDPLTGAPVGAPITSGPVAGLTFGGDILFSSSPVPDDAQLPDSDTPTGISPSPRGVPTSSDNSDGDDRSATPGGVPRPSDSSDGVGSGVRRWDPVAGTPLGEPFPDGERPAKPNPGGRRLTEPLPGGGQLAATVVDDRPLMAAVDGMVLRVWDAATGTGHATMRLPGPATLLDLAVLDGRLLALTVSGGSAVTGGSSWEDGERITLWDVAAAAPVRPPTTTTDDGCHGAFGLVDGRLVVAHGVDADKNRASGEGVWPEETGDIYVHDVATGEPVADFRGEAGWNQQLLLVDGLVLQAAADAVLTWDARTGRQAASPVRTGTGQFTCVAAIKADGHIHVAAGDWAGTIRIWQIPRP